MVKSKKNATKIGLPLALHLFLFLNSLPKVRRETKKKQKAVGLSKTSNSIHGQADTKQITVDFSSLFSIVGKVVEARM